MSQVAVFDIGSTNCHYGVGDPETGSVYAVSSERTRSSEIVDQVTEIVDDVDKSLSEPLQGISIASSGTISKEGIVRFDPLDTTERSKPIPLQSKIHRRFGLPAYVENDGNAAACGEYYYGAGQNYDCIIHVSFGSGIGGGICINGELFRGEHGYAGEIGLLPIHVNNKNADSLGVQGAWEAFSSGSGLPKFVLSYLEDDARETPLRTRDDLEAKDVFAAARSGDEVALDIMETIGEHNAAGMGAVVSVYNPGLITLSGSVAMNNPNYVLDPIKDRIDEYTSVELPVIQLSDIADRIGLYGALAVYKQTTE